MAATIETGPEPVSTSQATWALFAGLAMVMIGNGLQSTLLGVRSVSAGFTLVATGVVMAGYYIGFLAGSRFAQYALGTVGHVRVFSALASTASTAILVHSISVNPITWFGMRFIFGLCMAGIYVVVESWLNDLATNETRGTLLSVYMVVAMLGVSGGQLLIGLADPAGFALFILASILISMSLVPVSLSGAPPPAVPDVTTMSIRTLAQKAPTGVVISFLSGLAAGTLFGVGSVYGSLVEMSDERIGWFMAAPSIGAVVSMMPIGWLSDRVPRRAIITVLCTVAALSTFALTRVSAGSLAAIGLMMVLGAAMFPLYSVGIAYTNDWLNREEILGAAGCLVRTNGAGAIIGPMIAAGLMAIGAPWMFFAVMGASHVAMGGYVVYRIVVVDNVPDQRDFVAYPVRSSGVATALSLRRRREKRNGHKPAAK